MDNTDDQENQGPDGNADATVETNLSDEHVNGQVTGEPESINLNHGNDNIELDQTGDETVPEDPPEAVSQPVEEVDGSPTPLPRTSGLLARRQATNPASTELTSMNGNIEMPDRPDEDDMNVHLEQQRTRTQTPDIEQVIAGEGPLTPRNNAGPFVFDGSAGRSDPRQLVVPGIPEVAGGNSPAS